MEMKLWMSYILGAHTGLPNRDTVYLSVNSDTDRNSYILEAHTGLPNRDTVYLSVNSDTDRNSSHLSKLKFIVPVHQFGAEVYQLNAFQHKYITSMLHSCTRRSRVTWMIDICGDGELDGNGRC